MSKKHIITYSIIATMLLSASASFASVAESRMYNDSLGRTHFFGINNKPVSSVLQEQQVFNDAVNDVDFQVSTKNKKSSYDDEATIPASSKSYYSYKRDTEYDPYGLDDGSGVNSSKSIYTDTLGRLHFFGKDSKIKD